MAKKLPWFAWYADKWLSDECLRSVSIAARGLWADMLSLMHKCDRRGYLRLAGKPVTAEQLARMTGCSTDEVSRLLAELLNSGVASVSDDGTVYSRNMIRDEQKRRLCTEAGRMGGNPKMKKSATVAGASEWQVSPGYVYAIRRLRDGCVKIGASVNPDKRRNRGSGSLRSEPSELIRMWPVLRMGEAEYEAHDLFRDKHLEGEWFQLSESDLDSLSNRLTLKGLLKGQFEKEDNLASLLYSLPSENGNQKHQPGVGGVGEGTTFRSSLPCDNPELYPAAKRIVKHYQATIGQTHTVRGGEQAAIAQLQQGRSEEQLKNAANGYARWCRETPCEPKYREGVKAFYTEGTCDQFLDYDPKSDQNELRQRMERMAREREDRKPRGPTVSGGFVEGAAKKEREVGGISDDSSGS